MSKTTETVLKVIGFFLALSFCYVLREVIGYILLAFVISAALKPEIDKLEKYKIPRALSAAFIFIVFISFFVVILIVILPPFFSEIQSFTNSFPSYWENWFSKFQNWSNDSSFGESIESGINNALNSLSQEFSSAFNFIFSFFGSIFNLFFALVVAFYFLVEGKTAEKFSNFIFGNDKKKQKNVLKYWRLAEEVVGRWVQGYFFLSVVVSIMVYIALTLLGVKHALLLAVLAGALEIVPWLGPLTSGAIGSLLALFQGGFSMAIPVVFVFFIVQQLENFLIVPSVMKNRVNLNPLLTLIAIFAGGIIWGIFGTILAVPITAILTTFWKEHQEISTGAQESFKSR